MLLYVVRTGLIYFTINEYTVLPKDYNVQTPFTFNHIIAVILGELYVIALASVIKLTVDWIYERQRADNLQKIQLKTELNFLKSQIQPHFFFNTLNNLYALTLEKSDVAPSVILKLSDIMQYVLYDASERNIRLFDEINYIQNYIDLERLRYGDRVESKTEIIGNIGEVQVPPLLFLPFIENCFKHASKENDKIKVYISFENKNDKTLLFKVENPCQQSIKMNENYGIGIENVKRRLELMFDKNFQLKTFTDNQKYCVQLKIPI